MVESASLSDILDAMTDAVEVDASVRRKFNAVVVLVVDGTSKTFDVRRQSSAAPAAKADLRVQTSLSILQDLLANKMTPQEAFMKGKLKIKGKMGLAMKLKILLDGTRKRLALQQSRL